MLYSRRALLVLFLVAATLTVTRGRCRAWVWDEAGDAGDLPGTAQMPPGSGSLTAIRGTLLAGGDADLYLIRIENPADFTAATCSGGVDTELWLFALNGTGITFADDSPDCGAGSVITGTHVPAAGFYYLGCSAYDWDALDGQGREIWLDAPYDQERAPDGPGALEGVAAWGDVAYESGAYEIALTGVAWSQSGLPDVPERPVAGPSLHPAAPNPFHTVTRIRYRLRERAPVRLCVYDAAGRRIRTLVWGVLDGPAEYSTPWNGRNDSGHLLTGGMYYYRLETPTDSQARRVVLLR